MIYRYIFCLLFLLQASVYCQHTVSGYANLANPEDWEPKVHLSRVQLNENTNTHSYIPITSSAMSEKGFFSFDKKWFENTDLIYKIHLNPNKNSNTLSKKIKNFKLFIISKNDSIYFDKGSLLFDNYTTNNVANKEWNKLKKFESQFENLHDNFDTEEYLLRTKGYVKDSLQILLVKLISIKKLDDKKLLEKDIKANTSYYTALLQELKSSDIDPSLFLYLENKLLHIKEVKADQKYTISLLVNIIAFLGIVVLIFLFIRDRNKNQKPPAIPLSKQESTIKELIISGKSNKEIANELFISISTVKTHVSNIYSKLNISSRRELILKK